MSSYPPPANGNEIVFNPTNFFADTDFLTLGDADKRYLKLSGGAITGSLYATALGGKTIEVENDTDIALTSSSNCNDYGLHLHSITSGTGIKPGSSISFNQSIGDNVPLANIALDKVGPSVGAISIGIRNGATCDEKLRIDSSGIDIKGSLKLNGATTDLSAISGVSAGSATASKALVLDSSKSVYGLSSMSFLNTTGTDCIILRQSPASCVARWQNSDTGSLIGTATAHPFYIQTGGSIRFYIAADGKMGNLTTPQYTMDIRGTLRGEGVLASSSTATTSPPAGELWAYKAGQAAGTAERNICYGRNTDDSFYSHYSFRSIYYSAANTDNHTVWSANGWNQGISMTQRGNVMIAGEGGYSAYEATEATLHVRGFKNTTVGAGWGYHSNGAYSVGGGTVPLSLKTTHAVHFQGNLYVTSDERLKTNIKALDDDEMMKILELTPIEYDWVSEANPSSKTFGFSAQQTLKVLPRLVSLVPNQSLDEVVEDGHVVIPDKCQLVMPLQNMIPYLAGVCKIQQTRIEKLESELASLKELVNKIATRPVLKKWLDKNEFPPSNI